MLKEKRRVFLCACSLDLMLTPVGQDVVHDPVLLAIVLMEATPRTADHEVVFHDHTGGSLVCIEPPAAVPVRNHVMEIVTEQNQGLFPKPSEINHSDWAKRGGQPLITHELE